MKKRYFSEKDDNLHHLQQPTYNANFHSPSDLDISNRRNKAAEYHSLLNRLPTLGEVLARKTQSPVDLWSFYLFMKDHEGAIDYLDFWLDVMHHLTLCKHYVKGLRESIIRNTVVNQKKVRSGSGAGDLGLPAAQLYYNQQPLQPSSLSREASEEFHTPVIPPLVNYRNSQASSQRNSIPLSEQSKHKSLSSSLLLEMIINDNMLEDTDSHRLSQFLRGDLSIDNNDPRIQELVEEYNRDSANEPLPQPQFSQSPDQTHGQGSYEFENSYQGDLGTGTGGKRIHSGTQLLEDDAKQIHPGGEFEQSSKDKEIGRANVASFASSSQAKYVNARGSVSTQKNNINPQLLEKLIKDSGMAPPGVVGGAENASSRLFVTRDNLRESSHNLLLKYFVEDAEKKISIPKDLNAYIVNSIEKEGRDDPDVFAGVRDYVFKLMENELFPKFLTTVAIQNITDLSLKIRIIAGLVFLFFGFWIAYILLFLNYAKKTRAVVVLPFLVAFYLIVSSIYYIDPILVLFGYSESFHKDRKLIRLKETFVHSLLIKRSIWVTFLILLFTVILTLVFSLVPGHRL